MPEQNVQYYERAALESYHSLEQWFRYLRKIFTPDGRTIPQEDIDALLHSDKLSEFQQEMLRQANIDGSPTNKYVISLNQKARTPMYDEVRRKFEKDKKSE